MKNIFLGIIVCLGLACSDAKQNKVEDAISRTSDGLNAKLDQLNDTLKKVGDDVKNRIPKVSVQITKSIPISLQWIGMMADDQGKAQLIKQNDGWFSIKGEQTNSNNEFLKINGKLKRIDANNVSFEGTVITYIKTINGGAPCEKIGNQTFLKKGDRKYYRLQNMVNCEGGKLVDYVDVYDLDAVL